MELNGVGPRLKCVDLLEHVCAAVFQATVRRRQDIQDPLVILRPRLAHASHLNINDRMLKESRTQQDQKMQRYVNPVLAGAHNDVAGHLLAWDRQSAATFPGHSNSGVHVPGRSSILLLHRQEVTVDRRRQKSISTPQNFVERIENWIASQKRPRAAPGTTSTV